MQANFWAPNNIAIKWRTMAYSTTKSTKSRQVEGLGYTFPKMKLPTALVYFIGEAH